MFILSIQINRTAFYWVYLIFFLHICTAFLTIINALNHDLYEKEEIIQLSMDSIHVLNSTESPILKTIEENIDGHAEQELLFALLASYDDDQLRIDNAIPVINSSSSIRFLPSSIHFPEQPITIPRMQTMTIINDDSEPLKIFSLVGTTNEFYSSFSKQTSLSSYGGNTTINIYYLPRTIGPADSIFTIKTSRGDFSSNVTGIGIPNPFRLRPLINIEIPLNSTYEYTIEFYNPYNHSLSINKIYTSDENLMIELSADKTQKNHLKKIPQSPAQWHFNPYETKSIIKLNYFAYQLTRLYGFLCIKTNFSEKIILPVEINVANWSGLYSNVDSLEFTSKGLLSKSMTTVIYAFNHGLQPVIITDVRVSPEHQTYLTVRFRNLPIPPDIHRLNQIADLTIDLNSIPDHIQHISGYVQVYTSMNDEEPMLKIPYNERIVHGSLTLKKDETYFYISNNQPTEECQTIRIFNRYNILISVSNITINKFELLSRYIQIKYPTSFFYLYPGQWTDLLCLTHLKQASLPKSIETLIDFSTNLSHFSVPIYLYNGFLTLDLLNDHTNGGIQQNENDPLDLTLTSIPMNTTRVVRFLLTNSNPIDVQIEQFDWTISDADIQLESMKIIDGNETKSQNILSQIVIPKQHQASFVLTIHGTNPPERYIESITIKTNYQILNINVRYEIINGSLELINQTPIHIDVFPNRLATADIFLQNKYHEPINITRIHFITYGLCFSFTWSNTSIDRVSLQPNKVQRIGTVNFDMAPLCKSILPPSESRSYCDVNHHPEMKHEWDESISLLNTYELDHILVRKFRNLWKEWRSLVRKQQLQTNVWLYTNRVNISWPMTIGFIWPSILERMSSSVDPTPMIVDFAVTFINMTKIENVTIINPSSDLLTYSVKLLNNSSLTTDQTFTIFTTSKQIELKNNLYNFHLLPNEQITFSISYRPTVPIEHETYLIIRNNLTIMESILLRGKGGIGGLQVGASVIPIVLEIQADQHKLCSNLDGNPVLQKTLILRNTGNIPTVISEISFGHSKCSGAGFSVAICRNIRLEAHEKYYLKILFQPTYTTDEINETLILNTSIGLMIFPIRVRIPQVVLSACYIAIARPPWEWRHYCLSVCSVVVVILLVFAAAVFDAQRLFHLYLVRAEWRDQIQTTNGKIFDLSDLSAAIQDEQKTCEPLESNETTDVKKEVKTKRSLNGNSVRSLDSSNTTNQSITVHSKDLVPKLRRATTDNGVSKLPKQPTETATKPLPQLRRLASEQTTSSQPKRPVSSSTISDEETEPFALVRSKRILSKRKGSFTKTSSKPIIDHTPPVTRKSSFQLNQTDLIQLDDSTNNQQWHTVSSSKGQRKGATSRRETSEESQTTNKLHKTSSTDAGQYETTSILTSSPRTHSLVSCKSIQSCGHHRLTQNPSSELDSLSTKGKNSQENESSIITNRELALRQLREQLWAAGLPSSTTAYSMSLHSRCSSTLPSERADEGDDRPKMNWNNNEEETIDWDDPDIPDEDFGRYASQTEQSMDDSNEIRVSIQQKATIPSLMSLSITPPPVVATNSQENLVLPTSVIKENIEPLPFHQHTPGPIQRPNKLFCPSTLQFSAFPHDSTRSPDTPEVLVQINHLVDHQNSILSNSSAVISGLSTPNVPWTPFSPPEWSSKYESSWPSTTPYSNPFAQRQISKDDSNLWPESSLNTSWLKFSSTRQENDPNNPPWNSSETQPNSWWPKTSSDENNNDQSRWEFAR